MKYGTYKHKRTGNLYTVTGFGKAKVLEVWNDVVFYNGDGKLFARAYIDFKNKFEYVQPIAHETEA